MRLQWREGMPAQPDTTAPRVAPLPSPPPAPSPPSRTLGAPATEPPAKLLIVGPDINLSGEITACDRLVVEGSVQVTLNRTRAIEIAETGRFTNGKATFGVGLGAAAVPVPLPEIRLDDVGVAEGGVTGSQLAVIVLGDVLKTVVETVAKAPGHTGADTFQKAKEAAKDLGASVKDLFTEKKKP